MSTRDFGRYSLVKKLATGGMAEVYLAHQKGPEGFQKHLVIKKILPHLAADDEFVSMFLNEARIAARFSHPNIVQIFDLGKEGDSYYIAMEYIHGEDLGRVMKQAWTLGSWVPAAIALKMIAGAAEGLYYAHTKADEHGRPLKVVHRDISPQNIIVTFEGGVKLVDFGIARAADQASHTATGAIKGKFAYMAPEQATGKPVDHRTDIFALGLVLYELLTGVRPFKRDSDIATLRAVLECNVQPPSALARVPLALDAVVMKALARHAEDRYQDARQFQQALEAFILSQRWNASTIDVSEYMKATFSERLTEESRLGRPDPRGADSASGVAVAPVFSPPNHSESSIPRLASNEFELAPDPEPSRPPPPTRGDVRRRTSGLALVSDEADEQLEEAWRAAQRQRVDDDPAWDRATDAGIPPGEDWDRATDSGVRTTVGDDWDRATDSGVGPPVADPWDRATDASIRHPVVEDDDDEATVAEPAPARKPVSGARPKAEPASAQKTRAEPLPPIPKPEGGALGSGAKPTVGAPAVSARELPSLRGEAKSGRWRGAPSVSGKRRSLLLMTEDEIRERQSQSSMPDEPSEISAPPPVKSPHRDAAERRSSRAGEARGGSARRGGGAARFALLLGVVAGLAVVALLLLPRVRKLDGVAPAAVLTTGGSAQLTLTSNVRVEVLLGDTPLGHTPLYDARIPAGEVKLTLQNQNLGIHRTVSLSAMSDEQLEHQETFNLGKLHVTAEQPCDVYINRRRVAQIPGPPLDFFEGNYDVECRNEPLGLVGRAHVKIQSRGRPVEVKIPLRPM